MYSILSCVSAWWDEYKGCRVPTVPLPPVFSYLLIFWLCQEPDQGLPCSIDDIKFHVMTVLSSWARPETVTLGLLVNMTGCVLMGRVSWGPLLLKPANVSMRPGCAGSWRGYHSFLLAQLSLLGDPL